MQRCRNDSTWLDLSLAQFLWRLLKLYTEDRCGPTRSNLKDVAATFSCTLVILLIEDNVFPEAARVSAVGEQDWRYV